MKAKNFSPLFYDVCRIAEPKNRMHYYYLLIRHSLILKGFRAVLFYRIINNNKNNPLMKKPLQLLNLIFNNIEIAHTAQIGPGLLIPHAQCIIIGGSVIIGQNVTVQQEVTLGANMGEIELGRKQPIIGDNVLISAGAKVLGPVTVGDNSIIGANAVVLSNIPASSVAVGIPAKIIGQVIDSYPVMLKKGNK